MAGNVWDLWECFVFLWEKIVRMKRPLFGILSRLLKWISLLGAGVVLLVVLLACLLYVPGIQESVKERVERSVAESTGMDIAVGRVLLRFPLNVGVEDVFVGDGQQDTLVAVGRVRVNVGLGRVLRGVVSVKELGVEDAVVHFRDTISGMSLDAWLGELRLRVRTVDLKRKEADVALLSLENGRVSMSPGVSGADTTGGESAPLDWLIRIDEIALNGIDYGMVSASGEMKVGVGEAAIRDGVVGLGKQTIVVDEVELRQGYCELLTAGGDSAVEEPVATDTVVALPWTVSVNRVELTDNRFYMCPQTMRSDSIKFPEKIDVTGLSLTIDSVYNRGTEVAARIRHLALQEACGVCVKDLAGCVELGEGQMRVDGLSLTTANSRLGIEATVEAGLTDFGADVPLNLAWSGKIGGRDLLLFVPGMDGQVDSLLRENVVAMDGNVRGTLNRLDLPDLRVSVGNLLALKLRGQVASLMEFEKAEGQVEMDLQVGDGGFARVFTGGGLTLPDSLRLQGMAELKGRQADVRLGLSQGEGTLTAVAGYGLADNRYHLNVALRDFDVEAFMPGDSVGRLTADLLARGKGWDVTRDSAQVELDVKSLMYKDYHYKNVLVRAEMGAGVLNGTLSSGNEALDLELAFGGEVTDAYYRGRVSGDVRNVDLQALHFSPTALAFSLGMDLSGEWRMSGEAGMRAEFSEICLDNGQANALGDLSLRAEASGQKTELDVDAGDLRIRFEGEGNLTSLLGKLTEVGSVAARQLEMYAFDMEEMQRVMPAFRFEMSAGKDNLINRYLKGNKLGFRNFDLVTGYVPGKDWRLGLRTDSLVAGGFVIDSVLLETSRAERALRYGVDVYMSPEQLNGMVELGVHGNVVDNQVNVRLREKGKGREDVFNVGADVAFEQEAVSVSLSPGPLVLGFMPWQVNQSNYVRVTSEGMIAANLRLSSEDKRVRIVSRGKNQDRPEALEVDIKGIELERISESLSFLPEMAGRLAVDIRMNNVDEGIDLAGNVVVDELAYQKKRVGDVKAEMRYKQTGQDGQQVEAGMRVDGDEAVSVRGVLAGDDGEEMNLDVRIPRFPLRLANVFTPDGTVDVAGILCGRVFVTGAMDAPRLNGELAFRDGVVDVAMIGTAFAVDSVPLVIKDNVLEFNKWGLIAPNKKKLELGGNVDFTSLDDVRMNTSLTTRNFQVIGVEKNDKTLVYGQAYMDLSTTVKGPLNALQVRGNVGLLGNTQLNYVLKSSPLDVSDKSEELVRFVSFRDTVLVNEADTLQELTTTSLDLLLTMKIDPLVSMNVLLSAGGQDRVSIQGGGELTYSLNPLGDSRLVGRYVLTGGLISYGLPVIGSKEFKIQDGNYVEWKGDLMNPEMNITAAETISASVTDDSQNSRLVNFQAMIKVGGSLEKLDVAFDLAVTGDLTIQNQLAGMTAEERAKEAMNLMLYGTYTAPGTVAKNNVSDNAINNLVEKELNEWSRKHLKGVDLSFGINSYNQVTEGGESKKTDYSYQFSKRLFNNKVRVSVGGRISTDNNPAESGGMEENLVDDISLEYMFGNSSKYFLKLFRHTGYESVLEGEVTQTGISVVLRKKFQEFLDIFRRKKNKQVEKVEENGTAEK